MLLCLVKGFGRHFGGLVFWRFGGAVLAGLLRGGQDREGPLGVEGKLLLGHAQQVRWCPGTADESLSGQQDAAAD